MKRFSKVNVNANNARSVMKYVNDKYRQKKFFSEKRMCYMLTMHLITKKVKLDVVRQAIEQKWFIMMLFVAWEKSNGKQKIKIK